MEQTTIELRQKVLVEAKVQLKMNLSLMEMLKGDTSLEDFPMLREEWIEPLEQFITNLRNQDGD